MTFRAGAAKSELQPKIGAELHGYFDRASGATGVHDAIGARALVISDAHITIALCSVDVCIIARATVDAIRALVRDACGIPVDNITVFATHTHSAPGLHLTNDWETSPIHTIADAIIHACQEQQPARTGTTYGTLHGVSINRRHLENPIDPCVGVVRIEALDGQPIALLGNFACHNVVLGADNLLVSGDWTGCTARWLEQAIGGVALLSLGGAGDINPVTEQVHAALQTGRQVVAIGEIASIYGQHSHVTADAWNIEERRGGTFEEAQALGTTIAQEMQRVWHACVLTDQPRLLCQTLIVDVGTPDAGENLPEGYRALLPEIQDGKIPMQISLLQVGDALLVTHPIETFAEDAVRLRQRLQALGFARPLLITYANGWYGYLPPQHAFAEGGYEVSWAQRFGLRQDGQALLLAAVVQQLNTSSPLGK